MKFRLLPICVFMFIAGTAHAQSYSALHGSNYSGGLGVYNNPSSILSSPYKWDVTVVAFQYQTISNVVKGPNFPFNLLPSATFYVADGNFKRYADLTTDVQHSVLTLKATFREKPVLYIIPIRCADREVFCFLTNRTEL
jgi:hypothetical protein